MEASCKVLRAKPNYLHGKSFLPDHCFVTNFSGVDPEVKPVDALRNFVSRTIDVDAFQFRDNPARGASCHILNPGRGRLHDQFETLVLLVLRTV